MKTTFRDAFIKHLQENLLSVNGMFSKPSPFNQKFAMVIVDAVEKATNKHITAKSPNWQFARLVAALDRTLTSSSGCLDDVFQDVVQRSRKAAGNEIRGIENLPDDEVPVQAIILGSDFTKLVDILKNFVNKQDEFTRPSTKLFQLEFEKDKSGESIVKAYACNGFMIAESEASCALLGKPFKAYISIPRLKPTKADQVSISLDGEYARVSFGDVEFRTRQPDGPMNLNETRKNIPLTGEAKTIYLNPQYLKTVAAAMNIAAERNERLKLTMHGTTEMVSFKCAGTEALLCPMRPPKSHFDTMTQKAESHAS